MCFIFNDTAATEIYTLSLHDALPIWRQAGSLFKLFVYLAAMQKGYDPQSTVVDRPTQIGDWEPQNANGRFRGPVSLRNAFAQSINTVAAQDRKSTRLNSSHANISYAVFCLKKKKKSKSTTLTSTW